MMQKYYNNLKAALKDWGEFELQARQEEIFNSLSAANQIMYSHYLTRMYAGLNAQENAAQPQSCKQCEDVPPPGEEDYS